MSHTPEPGAHVSATVGGGGVPDEITETFDVFEQIGIGGHAAVYRGATRIGEGAPVAIKLLHAPLAGESERRRFERECASLYRLREHPNVVRLLDAGVDERGRAYLITPLYDGTLADRLGSLGPLPPHEVTRLSADVAAALSAAHSSGIVHRDVKPSNVFMTTDGTAVLGDFGAAGLVDAHTITGSVALSIAYAAPEMLELGEMSASTDLYSLGVTMYQMLTGSLPFGGSVTTTGDHGGLAMLVRRVATEVPDPIEVPGLPDSVQDTVMRLLAKSPDDRPVSAAMVLDTLRQGPATVHPIDQPHAKRWFLAGAAVFAAVLVGVGSQALRSPTPVTGSGALGDVVSTSPSDGSGDGTAESSSALDIGQGPTVGALVVRDAEQPTSSIASTELPVVAETTTGLATSPRLPSEIWEVIDVQSAESEGTEAPPTASAAPQPEQPTATSPSTVAAPSSDAPPVPVAATAPPPVPAALPPTTLAAEEPDQPATTEPPVAATAAPPAPNDPCAQAGVLACDDWEQGIGGWTDETLGEQGRMFTSAKFAKGEQSLALRPQDFEGVGRSAFGQRIELAPGDTRLYVKFDLYVDFKRPNDFWMSMLVITDRSGRRWRLNLHSAQDRTAQLSMFTKSTEDLDDEGLSANMSSSFALERWHCVEFVLRPDRENGAVIRVDGDDAAILTGFTPEPLGEVFHFSLGMPHMSDTSATPHIYIDDLVVSSTDPSC